MEAGQFTQQDPIGLAGGANLYGFAAGDPANFGDPFGLCPDPRDPDCKETVQQAAMRAAKEWFANSFERVVSTLGALGLAIRREAPSLIAKEVAWQAALPAVGAIRNSRRVAAVAAATGRFLTENRHLRNAALSQHDWGRVGLVADDVVELIARNSGWATAEQAISRQTMRIGGVDIGYSIFRSESPGEWVLNAWIR